MMNRTGNVLWTGHVTCLIGLITMLAGVARAQDPPWATQIDALVQPYLDESIVVGLVVGAIRGDESTVRGYGRVNLEEAAKPDGRTLFEIGSVTKTFTGLLLAESVVDGRLRLDQPLAELLPDGVRLSAHADGPIRLEHLATHVSGLPRLPTNLTPKDARDPYADYGKEQLNTFLSGYTLPRGPGVEIEYSNLAFGLLGEVLAAQADSSYGELLHAKIAEPLEMNDTAVEVDTARQARLATPYNVDLTEDQTWRFQAMAGAGGIYSTADDMLRFARAHLEPPEGPLGEAIELAWKVRQQPIEPQDFAMGLGWHVARDGETRWHNGQTGGYHCMLLINRKLDLAVVVLTNTATMEVDALAEQLVRALAGMPERPREFAKTVEVSAEQMQRLVGRYQLAPTFILDVKIEGDQLMVGATGQPYFRVYPQSVSSWRYRVVDAALTFELGEAGPAAAVTLHQNGLDQRAERLAEPD